MSNIEAGLSLLREAEGFYEDVLKGYERGSWNAVVRRAQEVVELALKGLMKMMGIEYPKIHDVGALFAEQAELKKLGIDSRVLAEIIDISAYLARERAPAFYMEKTYTKEQAIRAKEDALKVLSIAKDISEKLSGV
jgi:HEPN domain-containing protein